MTDNAMDKEKATIYKALHRELKIDQREQKPEVN
jgi:hypothetical protein